MSELTYNASNPADVARAHAEIDRRTKGRFTMTLTKEIGTRSARQNRMLWAIYEHVAVAMEDAGWARLDKDGVHHEMRMRFHYTAVVDPRTGEERRIPKTTTKMSTRTFSAYVENIVQFASELGYAVPMPSDYEELTTEPKETRHAA